MNSKVALVHRGLDLHVHEGREADEALAEDAHLWPGLGEARVDVHTLSDTPSPLHGARGISARQRLDQLAFPIGATEPVLLTRLVHREGRNAGLWVHEAVKPGFWRVRTISQRQDAALELALLAVRKRLRER